MTRACRQRCEGQPPVPSHFWRSIRKKSQRNSESIVSYEATAVAWIVRVRFLWFMFTTCLAGPLLGAATVRVAVLPGEPALAVASDLLTAELSSRTNLILLERA